MIEFTLARSNRYSPGPARLAPGVRAAGAAWVMSASSDFFGCVDGDGSAGLAGGETGFSSQPGMWVMQFWLRISPCFGHGRAPQGRRFGGLPDAVLPPARRALSCGGALRLCG